MKNLTTGFTLVEIMVVLAVMGLLVLVVLPRFSNIRELQILKASTADSLSAIDKARSQTLGSLNQTTYGVHFESNSITLFIGTAYTFGNASNEVISIASPASITNVTLGGVSGSSGDFYFNRLTGAPSKTGTIIIVTPNYSKTITLNATGTAVVN